MTNIAGTGARGLWRDGKRERLERLTKEAVAWREASQLRAYAKVGLRRLQLREAPSDADEAHRVEALGLRWEDVGLQAGRLSVE